MSAARKDDPDYNQCGFIITGSDASRRVCGLSDPLTENNMECIDNMILVIQPRVSTSLCVKDISEAVLSAPLMVGFMSVVKKA